MEFTCGNCEKLKITKVLNAVIAGCGENDLVVPHQMETKGKNSIVTFTRIPEFCPQNDVNKSSKPAPVKHHIVREY